MVGWLVGWLIDILVSWLEGWLVGWFVGRSAGRLDGLPDTIFKKVGGYTSMLLSEHLLKCRSNDPDAAALF